MATANLASVAEYLHSVYEPDAEYVEGKIVRRAVPQKPHSKMQGFLLRTLHTVAKPLGYEVWVEQRICTQQRPARYRVPDLCVTVGEPNEDVFTTAPFLCVEVLSPDDSALEVRTKVREYLAAGVAYVWVIEPVSGQGEIYTRGGIERVENHMFRAGDVSVCTLY